MAIVVAKLNCPLRFKTNHIVRCDEGIKDWLLLYNYLNGLKLNKDVWLFMFIQYILT